MTKRYIATFSDGTSVKRVTKDRTYTHAWYVRRRNRPENVEKYGEFNQSHGFCGTEQLARNTLVRYAGHNDPVTVFAEIAPAREISGPEFRRAGGTR